MKRVYCCDRCGRKLKRGKDGTLLCIRSDWTKSRYCYVNQGCFGKKVRR